jgi:hypothetical protein
MIIRRLIFAIIMFIGLPITVLTILLTIVANIFIIIPIKWIITGDTDLIESDKIVKICTTPLDWLQRKLKVEY